MAMEKAMTCTDLGVTPLSLFHGACGGEIPAQQMKLGNAMQIVYHLGNLGFLQTSKVRNPNSLAFVVYSPRAKPG